MKRGRVFPYVLFIMCAISLKSANADPALDLWMAGGFDGTSTIEVWVSRTNVDFGLGGLSYNLQFSESLNLTREYSFYGWIANDGLFDNSNPGDDSTGSFTSIYFDTAHDPAGTEFSAGSGTVESLTIEVTDLTPRWIYFDILSPSASNGSGADLLNLGGTLDVIPDDTQAPESGHTLAVYVPEPATMLFLSLGGIFVLKKHRK